MIKYIDAELLKKGLKELESVIYSNELVGQSMHPYDCGQLHAIKVVKELINSLQQEQPSEGYDEAYLNEKIAKASKTWKGVDVDKYMAEMRGYEQPSEDLKKEIDSCWQSWLSPSNQSSVEGVLPKSEFSMYALHFYELGKKSK